MYTSPPWIVDFNVELDGEHPIKGVTTVQLLHPNMQNEHNVMFGGETLKNWDEISGLLAMKHSQLEAVHLSHMPLFILPVQAKHEFTTNCYVVYSFPGFVLMYSEVYSSRPEDNNKEKLCYKGYALCATIRRPLARVPDPSLPEFVMVRNPDTELLYPDGKVHWDNMPKEIYEGALSFFKVQKTVAKQPGMRK